jgi:hypothetical protein
MPKPSYIYVTIHYFSFISLNEHLINRSAGCTVYELIFYETFLNVEKNMYQNLSNLDSYLSTTTEKDNEIFRIIKDILNK